jgi:hypothetical protein
MISVGKLIDLADMKMCSNSTLNAEYRRWGKYNKRRWAEGVLKDLNNLNYVCSLVLGA